MRLRLHLSFWLAVGVALAAFVWLLRDNRPGDAQPRPIAIADLRALAVRLPGAAPSRVEVQLVGWRQTPRDMVAAGGGLRPVLIAALSYRLVRNGAKAIVIDGGLRPAAARTLGLQEYDRGGQAKVQAALRHAGLVLLTSEHPDHSDGLSTLPDRAPVIDRLSLNAPQQRALALPPGAAPPTISGTAPQAVAPGVVAIPTPEISAGAQMIYVRLRDGREYLFTGDAAVLNANWRELRAAPRLAVMRGAAPDRHAAFTWLRTIRALHREAPALLVIPGHDLTYLRSTRGGNPLGLKDGFTREAPPSRAATT